MKYLARKKILYGILTACVVLISAAIATPFLAHAQGLQYVPLARIGTAPEIYQAGNFGIFLNSMMRILIGLAGVLAVLLIVIGGFQYVTTTSEGGKGSARERITNALIGLVILLGSWLLLNTINPDLINARLFVQPIPQLPQQQTPGQQPVYTPPPTGTQSGQVTPVQVGTDPNGRPVTQDLEVNQIVNGQFGQCPAVSGYAPVGINDGEFCTTPGRYNSDTQRCCRYRLQGQ